MKLIGRRERHLMPVDDAEHGQELDRHVPTTLEDALRSSWSRYAAGERITDRTMWQATLDLGRGERR